MRNLSLSFLYKNLYKTCKKIFGLATYENIEYGEKDSNFYDRTFTEDESWKSHYTKSPYYFCWTVIIDRLRRAGAKSILEIGCGSGQLACAIRDAKIVNSYCGFDFSKARLQQARKVCSEFKFELINVFETDLFEKLSYDTAISTEFLEHVERDLEVVEKLRTGTRFIGTVPNFPFVSHVRHFLSCEEVAERYGKYFQDFTVTPLLANDKGKKFFIIEGIKKSLDEILNQSDS